VDEASKVVWRREGRGEEGKGEEVLDAFSLSVLLNLLQGTGTAQDMVFVMTTNRVEVLDEALVRRGRFDLRIELGRLDRYQVGAIYKALVGREAEGGVLEQMEEGRWETYEVSCWLANKYLLCGTEVDLLECLREMRGEGRG
jgi:hypothetical protein